MGTWIEIHPPPSRRVFFLVVPYVGTWIEMRRKAQSALRLYTVVPYVGTWIEMEASAQEHWTTIVVPYVGTWIEISRYNEMSSIA